MQADDDLSEWKKEERTQNITGSKSFHRKDDNSEKQNDPKLAMMRTGQKVQSSNQSGTTTGPTAADRPEPTQKDSRPILDGAKFPSETETTRQVQRKIPKPIPRSERPPISMPVQVQAIGLCPMCGKVILKDRAECIKCGWMVVPSRVVPLPEPDSDSYV
jgi:hypothetical protein